MSVKEAFEVSAGWVFIELAKKIGKRKLPHWWLKTRFEFARFCKLYIVILQ
jgi:beta-lactamase class D